MCWLIGQDYMLLHTCTRHLCSACPSNDLPKAPVFFEPKAQTCSVGMYMYVYVHKCTSVLKACTGVL